MSITEITVTNLSDLLAKITPSEPDPLTRRRRDTGVYRGAGDAWAHGDVTEAQSLEGAARDVEEEVVRLALEKVRGEKLVAKAIRDGMSAVEAFKTFGIM